MDKTPSVQICMNESISPELVQRQTRALEPRNLVVYDEKNRRASTAVTTEFHNESKFSSLWLVKKIHSFLFISYIILNFFDREHANRVGKSLYHGSKETKELEKKLFKQNATLKRLFSTKITNEDGEECRPVYNTNPLLTKKILQRDKTKRNESKWYFLKKLSSNCQFENWIQKYFYDQITRLKRWNYQSWRTQNESRNYQE